MGDHEIEAYLEGYIKVVKKVTVDPELLGMINFELRVGNGERTFDESVITGSNDENNNSYFFSILIVLFASLALLAGFLILQRNFFQICLISSFLSIFSFGFGLGMICGIIACILIILSRSSFNKYKNGSNFDSLKH